MSGSLNTSRDKASRAKGMELMDVRGASRGEETLEERRLRKLELKTL